MTDRPYASAPARVASLRRSAPGSASWRAVVEVDCAGLDPNDLIARSEGFLVHEPGGLVGVVERVELGSGHAAGDLVVASGARGELVSIPFSRVVEIVPDERRILVCAAHRTSDSNRRGLRKLLGRFASA